MKNAFKESAYVTKGMISSIEKWLANCPSGCGCGDRESAYVTKGGYLGAIGGVSRDRYRSGGG
jgi:hypothetical protein